MAEVTARGMGREKEDRQRHAEKCERAERIQSDRDDHNPARDATIEMMRRMSAQNPNNEDIATDLGVTLYMMAGRFDEGLSQLRSCASRFPKSGRVHYELGLALYSAWDRGGAPKDRDHSLLMQAAEVYRECNAVDPTYRDARSNLVVCLKTAASYGLASNEEYHTALVDALKHETGNRSNLVSSMRGICDCCGKLEQHLAGLVEPELFGSGTYAEHHNTTAAPVKKLLKCSKCHVAFYCGVECQRIAWKSHHKQECKLLHRQAEIDKVNKAKQGQMHGADGCPMS